LGRENAFLFLPRFAAPGSKAFVIAVTSARE
jgi:hypothetical protein